MHSAKIGYFVPVLMAMVLVPSTASATVIDFNTLTGSNGQVFNSYSENGFTVANATGQFYVAMLFGNPVPDVYALGVGNGASGLSSLSLIQTGGGSFSFNSLDFFPDGMANYTLTGTLSGSPVFSVTGSYNNEVFNTISLGNNANQVNLVTLSFFGQDASYNVDNIVVNAPVPEPTLGTLLGVAAAGLLGRRRRSV